MAIIPTFYVVVFITAPFVAEVKAILEKFISTTMWYCEVEHSYRHDHKQGTPLC